jgi:uncharacterized iron-regulated protein
MTVREKIEQILIDLGMFQQQAQKVMDIVVPQIDAISEDYQIEWDNDFDIYEDEMYEFLFSIVKPETLKWNGKHCPKAWFKENFID